MTAIETDRFRERLQEERTRLKGAIDNLHDSSSLEDELGEIGSGGVDNHLGDTASATYDRELDEGLEEGAQQTLAAVDAALRRIEDGTYGTCEACGGQIAVERLEALPWARLCIEDQRKRDR